MPAISSLHRPDLVQAVYGYGDEKVTVTLDRKAVTYRWALEAGEAAAAEDLWKVAGLTVSVIHSWDIVNDDGSPYPVTVDNLAALPLGVVVGISVAINEAARPSEQEGKDLSGPPNTQPSASTPPQDASPNGPPVSPSPAPSASPSLT